MESLKKLKEAINEIITSSNDENLVKSLGAVIGNIDAAEEENKKLAKDHEELIHDYGKLIVAMGTKEEPKDEEKEEPLLTLEDIINNVTKETK